MPFELGASWDQPTSVEGHGVSMTLLCLSHEPGPSRPFWSWLSCRWTSEQTQHPRQKGPGSLGGSKDASSLRNFPACGDFYVRGTSPSASVAGPAGFGRYPGRLNRLFEGADFAYSPRQQRRVLDRFGFMVADVASSSNSGDAISMLALRETSSLKSIRIVLSSDSEGSISMLALRKVSHRENPF